MNRDYTKRPEPYKKDTLVLKVEANQVAKAAARAIAASGDHELLIELLVREYYNDKPLYKKHRAEYLQ